MGLKQRTLILGTLALLAAVSYGVLRYYSPSLVAYVVEQTLLQKLPAGTDPEAVRRRFRAFLHSQPDGKSRLDKLLVLSQYLEKIQRLDSVELDTLLGDRPGRPGEGRE